MDEILNDSTIAWLLDGDPSIRWQVLRDVLDAPQDEVERARQAMLDSGWVRDLLDLQDPEGTWAGGLYSPKWTSTTYTLLLLRRCGLPRGSPAALRGVALLWNGTRYFGGGLTPSVGADHAEACVTGMYVALARCFGHDDDRRVDDAIDWLVANQLEDGGWNCEHLRSGDTHSSFHTSISVLEALAEVKLVDGPRPDIDVAMDRGREFFLAHRLYKSHRTGEVVHPAFTMLSFPPRWHYDVLRGLDYFQSVAAPWDRRFDDAVELLRGRRRRDGAWPIQHKHSGRVWFDMESGRQPSRWNTLRAARVLRWVDRVRP